jgi:hypothetical protein
LYCTKKERKMTSLKNKKFLLLFLLVLFAFPFDKAGAATLYIQPSQTTVSVGNIVRVQLSVDTSGKVINNAESIVQFPKDLLEVVSLDKSASVFTLWVEEPSFSNGIGQTTFNGGVPNPGYQGGSGKIISITFRAKKAGTASIIFTNSAVRENDGLGTDILSGQRGATITITSPTEAVVAPVVTPTKPKPEGTVGASKLTSKTHPDQSKWYADNTPEFSWELPSGALEVRTLIGKNPSGTPSVSYVSLITKKKVDELPDGTYYFSLQVRTAAGWSTTSRYRVNIDTTPPKPFVIEFPHGNSSWEPRQVVLFSTTDSESGISHYEIKVGNEAKPVRTESTAKSNPYVLPPQVPGTHTLLVMAVDNAGNVRNGTAEFTVEAINSPTITYYPETIADGELLRIRGTTYPNSEVTAYIRKGDTLVSEEYAKSNSSGDFALVVTESLDPGTYTFTARVKDERGAQSIETAPLTVSVQSEFLTGFVSFVLKYLSAALLALLALGALAWVLIFLWFRIPRTIQRMRRDAREAEKVSERAFRVLRAGVANHVARLKKLKRGLTDEESEFLEEFEQKLEEAEEMIAKEIHDVLRP